MTVRELEGLLVRAGVATADLGGNASTSDFTDSVIARVRAAMSALPPAAPA